MRGNVVEESRGRHFLGHSPGAADSGSREVEPLPGAGDGHVGQAAFFCEFCGFPEGSLVREGSVLHASDKDDRKFETFGRVNSHQGDLAGALFFAGHLVGVRDQGNAFQESGEGSAVVSRCRVVAGHRMQFGEIFDSRGVLRVIRASQFREVSRTVENFFEDLRGVGAPRFRCAQGFDESPESRCC